MDNILEEASAVLQCKTCQWYRNCVTPMRVSPEDLQRQFRAMMGNPGMAGAMGADMRVFIEGTSSALQNMILEGCPVFISRLRTNEKLAMALKKLMQTWGEDREQPERR